MNKRMAKIEDFFELIVAMHRAGGTNKDDFLKKFGLNRAKSEILYFVAHHRAISVKEIAKNMGVTSSAATQLVDGLVKAGFLKRDKDKKDRRTVLVDFSESGLSKFKKFKQAHISKIAAKLQPLSEAELDILIRLHKKVLEQKIK